MNPVHDEPMTDLASLEHLVQKCASLCESAESTVSSLAPDRESFLAQNLESALQQLELILRVLGRRQEPRGEEHQGFLKRLFGRPAEEEEQQEEEETLELPDFDVSQQGLQGNSRTIPLVDLIGFLANGHKTGVLWVDTPGENFVLGLASGRLTHATSDCTPEGLRLGEVLVGLGFLTRRQLERFLAKSPDGEGISGESLLDTGMISDDELKEALVHQVRHLFGRLVATTSAMFRFSEGMKLGLAFDVSLDVHQLILETMRTQDEVGNEADRAAFQRADWQRWQRELSNKVTVQQNLGPAQQPASGAGPKPAAPKPAPQETPKSAPATSAATPEASKPETSKPVAAKPDSPKPDSPKPDAPRPAAAKPESPKKVEGEGPEKSGDQPPKRPEDESKAPK